MPVFGFGKHTLDYTRWFLLVSWFLSYNDDVKYVSSTITALFSDWLLEAKEDVSILA